MRILIWKLFIGVQSPRLEFQVEGAPNFRAVAGQQIFGSAMPTVEGMKHVLERVGCAPQQNGGKVQVGLLCSFSVTPKVWRKLRNVSTATQVLLLLLVFIYC